jgi:hypothetical protein
MCFLPTGVCKQRAQLQFDADGFLALTFRLMKCPGVDMLETRSAFASLSIHVLVLMILFGLLTHRVIPVSNPEVPVIQLPLLKPYMGAAGAGGQRSSTPASAGRLPKTAPRQFVPPTPVVNLNPKLAMVATIEAPADVPDLKLPNVGDPNGLAALSSAGSGGPAGYGNGPGTGVGSSARGRR